MSGKTKLAGALGVADLLGADLRTPLPTTKTPKNDLCKGGGYPKPSPETSHPVKAPSGSFVPKSVGTTAEVRGDATKENEDKEAVTPEKAIMGTTTAVAKSSTPPMFETQKFSMGYGHGVRAEALSSRTAVPSKAKACVLAPAVSPNAHCTISESQGSSEIRTKVFRIGAPLLRSTIPVSLGGKNKDAKVVKTPPGDENEKDGSDIETILSLSDGEVEHEGQLSVTLDFPC